MLAAVSYLMQSLAICQLFHQIKDLNAEILNRFEKDSFIHNVDAFVGCATGIKSTTCILLLQSELHALLYLLLSLNQKRAERPLRSWEMKSLNCTKRTQQRGVSLVNKLQHPATLGGGFWIAPAHACRKCGCYMSIH